MPGADSADGEATVIENVCANGDPITAAFAALTWKLNVPPGNTPFVSSDDPETVTAVVPETENTHV